MIAKNHKGMYYLSISLLCIVNDSVREKRREEKRESRQGMEG